MTNQNQSKHTSGLWQPEESWRSKVIGFWCGSTSARTTRFSAKPRSIGTARRSHGWVDCAWRLSILDASDKSNIVTEFLSAEIGVERKILVDRLRFLAVESLDNPSVLAFIILTRLFIFPQTDAGELLDQDRKLRIARG